MFELIAQSGEISNDWIKWIIGGLVAAVVALAGFAKWMFTTMINKTEKGLSDTWVNIKDMHGEAMKELRDNNQRCIENTGTLSEIKTDIKETKYAIQTLNTKVRCKNEESANTDTGTIAQ